MLESPYSILPKSYPNGKHEVVIPIEKDFFTQHEEAEWYGGDAKAIIILEKKEKFISLHIQILGEVEVECDRCLDKMMQPFEFEGELFVGIGTEFVKEKEDEEEGYMTIDSEAMPIELGHYFYESIVIALPIQRMHLNEDDCNPEMVKQLKHTENEETTEIDPRWEALMKLKDKEKE